MVLIMTDAYRRKDAGVGGPAEPMSEYSSAAQRGGDAGGVQHGGVTMSDGDV
jgi:hypothetical protein